MAVLCGMPTIQYSAKKRFKYTSFRYATYKQVGMERASNIIISVHRKNFFNYYEYSTNY